ncbi:hypothetical protein [Hyalangium minutum]|uniref:Uncharacterized protein n=1 Tax=Hyalangium minutum TaxID=394096 RepID=A0A085WGS4_9BACT|nr:hypothetical protein [Hyalangium minutum]KFE66887.1 hypothetical protein DB31_9101 [Hyalangium minutum]
MRYFGVLALLAAVLGGSIMFHKRLKAEALEAQKDADAARIQKDYLERVGWMRTNPDEKSYREELAPFFKTYFEQVDAHLTKYKGNKEFDSYIAEVERKAEGGKDEKVAERKAAYEYTRKVFDAFRKGKYSPVWTATDKGMRLDVVSADVVMVQGTPQVRFLLALWGAQRELKDDGKVKKMITSAAFEASWKLTDAKGKLFGEMKGQDPSNKIDYPERYIAEFPPQMVLGHYDMDLVPSEVAKMEIAFKVSSRSTSGGTADANYLWKLDVPSDWRLSAGMKWEGATEETRPEEEIDPAAAAKTP